MDVDLVAARIRATELASGNYMLHPPQAQVVAQDMLELIDLIEALTPRRPAWHWYVPRWKRPAWPSTRRYSLWEKIKLILFTFPVDRR